MVGMGGDDAVVDGVGVAYVVVLNEILRFVLFVFCFLCFCFFVFCVFCVFLFLFLGVKQKKIRI